MRDHGGVQYEKLRPKKGGWDEMVQSLLQFFSACVFLGISMVFSSWTKVAGLDVANTPSGSHCRLP